AGLHFEKNLNDTLGRAMLDNAFKSGQVYADSTKPPAGSPSVKQSNATSFTKLVGLSLGENQSHQEVKVKREIGSSEGYDDKLQAIAVARMAHTDPAAVVRVNGKWHAVETSAQMEPTYYDGEDMTRIRNKGDITFEAMPSYADVKSARDQVASLHQQLDKLEQRIKEKDGNPDDLKQQRDEVFGKLQQARHQLAGLLFAADDTDVQFNTRPFNDTPGKINIDPYGKPDDPLGDTHYEGGKSFDSGARPTFGIKLDELENPDEAAGVLFHEVGHVHDMEMARKWVDTYTKETGKLFVPGGEGRKPFETWIKEQAAKHPPRLSKTEAEMVVDRASESDGRTSEARSFVETALTAIQVGAPQVAIQQFETYAKNTKTEHHRSGNYQNPQDRSIVPDALTQEVLEAYKHMSKDQQKQLQDAIAAAKAANPESWVAKIKLPK
ncbi:MAG TPA: hypothetical protein VK466_16755, partial [Terriglobales bacterium]|nr:hypothetical protein [Terriglobales bacterium]